MRVFLIKKNSLRRLIAKLVVLLGTGLVTLLIAEFCVRLLLPTYRPSRQFEMEIQLEGFPLGPKNASVRQATPKGDFDLMIEFGPAGFRDRRDLRTSPPGALFALGDSFTFGYGVEEKDRFSSRLESALGEPIYNVALPENFIGYQRFQRYAESLGARMGRLVVGVCMENDIRDYRDGKSSADLAGRAGGLRRWLQTHSALYLFLSQSIQSNGLLRSIAEKTGASNANTDDVPKNIYTEQMLATCRDELLKALVGREAIVLIIPSRALWKGGNEATERKVQERFIALVRDAGIKVVDPTPRFEEHGKPLDYYFTTDPHWTPEGHRIAAEELIKEMRR